MTKDKMKELHNKSQEIISTINRLGIEKYYNYSIKNTTLGNFLVLNDIPLIDTYLDNDLSKFIF